MNDSNSLLLPGIMICVIGLLIPVVLTIFPPNFVRHQEPQDNTLKHSAIVTSAFAKGEAKLEQAHELFHDLKLQAKKATDRKNEGNGVSKETSGQSMTASESL